MFKKLFAAAVIGGLAVAAVKGTKAGREAWNDVRSGFRTAFTANKTEAEPTPEQRLARLEKKHRDLLKVELPRKIHDAAKAQVDAQDLDRQVAETEKRQQDTQKALVARLEAIEKANGQVVLDGRPVQVADALLALERDKNQWKIGQQTLATLRTTREQARDNAKTHVEQLHALKAEIDQIGVEIQKLKADLAQVRLQQVKSEYQADDTALAAMKDDLREARTQIELERQKQALTNEVHGKVPSVAVTPPPAAPSIADLKAEILGTQPTAQAEKPAPAPAPATMPRAD